MFTQLQRKFYDQSHFISTDGVLCGPLHTPEAVEAYKNAIEDAKAQGGTVAFGGKVIYQFDFIVLVFQTHSSR